MTSRNSEIVIPLDCRGLVNAPGEDQAFKLIENFGGTRVFVPAIGYEGNRLTHFLSDEDFKILSQLCGGDYLKVPVACVWRIVACRAQGMTYPEIAEKVCCSENTVQRTLYNNGLTKAYTELEGRE